MTFNYQVGQVYQTKGGEAEVVRVKFAGEYADVRHNYPHRMSRHNNAREVWFHRSDGKQSAFPDEYPHMNLLRLIRGPGAEQVNPYHVGVRPEGSTGGRAIEKLQEKMLDNHEMCVHPTTSSKFPDQSDTCAAEDFDKVTPKESPRFPFHPSDLHRGMNQRDAFNALVDCLFADAPARIARASKVGAMKTEGELFRERLRAANEQEALSKLDYEGLTDKGDLGYDDLDQRIREVAEPEYRPVRRKSDPEANDFGHSNIVNTRL